MAGQMSLAVRGSHGGRSRRVARAVVVAGAELAVAWDMEYGTHSRRWTGDRLCLLYTAEPVV